MALTEIYVDPSIATDSGSGTIGDPYGDLEYAIEQETFDTTNGTRVNIKAGTDEVLAAGLQTALADTSVSIAWAPSLTAPLVFEGYISAAGDGGIGGISAATSGTIINSTTLDFITFKNLHLHSAGYTNDLVTLDDVCAVIGCELNNADDCINMGLGSVVIGCYLHDFDNYGIFVNGDSLVEANIVDTSEKSCVGAIATINLSSTIRRNIVSVRLAEFGIIARGNAVVDNNSIISASGTAAGIFSGAAGAWSSVKNNIIEGFSGAGGRGIDLATNGGTAISVGGNSFYNCTTNSDYSVAYNTIGSDETLTSSAFTDASNLNFSPVDVGSVKEGSVEAFFTI